MTRVRADLRTRPAGTRSVVLAHTFVAGAVRSESERDISVGGVHSVGVETFDGVDYAALGHLHGRHTLAPHLRYSGSPLAYSFSEAAQVKGSWLVELSATGLGRVEFVEAPVPRPLARISGTLDTLLQDPAHAHAERAWVQATLKDARRPKRAMEQLQRRFPHILALAYEPAAAGVADLGLADPAGQDQRLAGRRDADVVAAFFADIAGRQITDDEAALVAMACDACRVAQDAAS